MLFVVCYFIVTSVCYFYRIISRISGSQLEVFVLRVLFVRHFDVDIFRGQTPEQADFNLLDTARKVELYGIRMHPAKVRIMIPDQIFLDLKSGHSSSGIQC